MVESVNAKGAHYSHVLSELGRNTPNFDNLIFPLKPTLVFDDVIGQVLQNPDVDAGSLYIENMMQRGESVRGLSVPAGSVDYYGNHDALSFPPVNETHLVITEDTEGKNRGDIVLARSLESAVSSTRSILRREKWLRWGLRHYPELIDAQDFIDIAYRKIDRNEFVPPKVMRYAGIGAYYKDKKGILILA